MGTDIRKKLFFEMAAKGWPIIGLEALGVSLEDIFITVVDESSKGTVERERERRAVRRGERGRGRTSLESTLANDMVAEADRKRAEDAKSGYADLDAQDVPEGHDDGTGQPTGKPDTGKED